MTGLATALNTEQQLPRTAEGVFPLFPENVVPAPRMFCRRAQARPQRQFSLEEVKTALRQDPVIFAPLMEGRSPFGAHFPVAASWQQDGEELAKQLTQRLNALRPDENGVTLLIACEGAYQKGRIGHLMIWNVSTVGGTLTLQVSNQENIAGRHYPTDKVNTVELWEQHDPSGSKNSNQQGAAVDEFLKTGVGMSVAHYGLFINLYPAAASENFAATIATLGAAQAGQQFGIFDGQKSCFTTARDMLGATRTRGPRGEEIAWDAGVAQPVVPVIFNKLSLLTNYGRQVGVETVLGLSFDLTDRAVRQQILADRMLLGSLALQLGCWINKDPGAYQVIIHPAL